MACVFRLKLCHIAMVCNATMRVTGSLFSFGDLTAFTFLKLDCDILQYNLSRRNLIFLIQRRIVD